MDGFDAKLITSTSSNDFAEGDAFTYTPDIPFNIAELASLEGGDSSLAGYLDSVLSGYQGLASVAGHPGQSGQRAEHRDPVGVRLGRRAVQDPEQRPRGRGPALVERRRRHPRQRRRACWWDSVWGKENLVDAEAKMKMHLANLTAATTAIQQNKIFGGADEILLPYLDSLYKESIDGKDHTIFTDVTRYWEDQFMEDMDVLNVMRPDVITRVTTYVPQIAVFVEQIIKKGFAYESDGSVYFDIAAFEKAAESACL